MSLKIESTTDSDESVKEALGNQTRLGDKPTQEAKITEEKPVEGKPAGDKSGKAAAEGTAEGEGDDKKPEPGKTEDERGGKNLDKRFSKLTKRAKTAEARAEDSDRRAAYWEQEAKRQRDNPAPKPEEKKVEAQPNSKNEPKEEDFEKHTDYLKAWSKWDRESSEETRKVETAKAETKAAMDNAWKSYSEKEAAFRKEKPDFMERLDAIKEAGIKMSPIVEDRIIRVGGPELAYELMKDPDEFRALCQMSPEEALEHIGVVRAQMKAAVSAKPTEEKKVTELKPQPKPISPVGSKVTVIKDPEKMSVREYDQWRRDGNSPN